MGDADHDTETVKQVHWFLTTFCDFCIPLPFQNMKRRTYVWNCTCVTSTEYHESGIRSCETRREPRAKFLRTHLAHHQAASEHLGGFVNATGTILTLMLQQNTLHTYRQHSWRFSRAVVVFQVAMCVFLGLTRTHTPRSLKTFQAS